MKLFDSQGDTLCTLCTVCISVKCSLSDFRNIFIRKFPFDHVNLKNALLHFLLLQSLKHLRDILVRLLYVLVDG